MGSGALPDLDYGRRKEEADEHRLGFVGANNWVKRSHFLGPWGAYMASTVFISPLFCAEKWLRVAPAFFSGFLGACGSGGLGGGRADGGVDRLDEGMAWRWGDGDGLARESHTPLLCMRGFELEC